jgi:hypothetical protein
LAGKRGDSRGWVSREALIRTLGQADAARVVEVLGGERIYVPAAADPAFSRLAARLGEEIARKVCAAFGGRVTFPQRLVPLDEEIGRLRREMLTPVEIARHLHCAERYVYLVLSRQ